MSLRNKIFITFSLLLLIPLITVGIFVQNIFKTTKSEEVINKVENINKQLNINLDMMIEDASRSTISLLYNKDLVNILRQYEQDTVVGFTNNDNHKKLSLILSSLVYKRNQIYGMHIFTNNGLVYSHMDSYKIEDHINLQEQKWYMKAKEKKGGWIIYFDRNPVYYKEKNKESVSFLRLLRDPVSQDELGIIRIDFDQDYLNDITNQIGNDDWLISTPNNEPLIGNQKNDLLAKCQSNKSWITTKESKEKYLCLTHKSNKTGLVIRNILSEAYLYSELKNFNQFLLLVIGICLLVSSIISYYMTRILLRPLELLKKRIGLFQENRVNNSDLGQSRNELVELGLAYDGMLSEIDDLVAQVYETNKRTIEAEYKALQAQMDPHFIFNTLESINMQAITKDQFEISDMIAELGKLIRFRLKNDEQQIPLSEEIIFAETYVNIMKVRLEDAFDIHWDVDIGVDDVLVPIYIIQPIIENSIMHGFSSNNKKLTIFVDIKIDGNTLNINIKDNGHGIKPEKLKEINQYLNKKTINKPSRNLEGKRNGIALANINSRLRMISEDSMLIISSKINEGTMIEIIIKK